MEKGFTDYIKETIVDNYANFNGRARRKEYWFFILFYYVLYFLFFGLAYTVSFFAIFNIIMALGLLIPSIAVTIRRMHDSGKSGWFMLVPFYNLYLVLKSGDVGSNQYGEDPKNPDTAKLDEIGKF
jgi:uncharacterized membrane protein YhaH (DUF805 family)